MNLAELYQWTGRLRGIFEGLGYWQMVGLGLFSYGVLQARACAPSRVAEHLGGVGKVASVERRLERWLANGRIDWKRCCVAWSGFVLRQYVGERLTLLVDETKLGGHLSVMVVGLAYRGCCIPLVFWCYQPDAWPMGQVALIEELLCWLAEVVPDGVVPLLLADRGLGTSPDLIRVVSALGWQYLFRVQGQTRFALPDGRSVALRDLVKPGGQWTQAGHAFKKAGWLPTIAHVLWDSPYAQAWCLLTNCPDITARFYACRYWQEAAFRDLKSDGWQWQASHIFSPDHANLLVLVLSIAYAFVVSLGTLAFEERALAQRVFDKHCSTFRNGLRLWQSGLTRLGGPFAHLAQAAFVLFDSLSIKTVGP